jgi:hypothetical protein
MNQETITAAPGPALPPVSLLLLVLPGNGRAWPLPPRSSAEEVRK